ncbi:MAG: Rne/Rng family ribonuclease, partial [Myxococcota bacterium]
MTKRMLISVDRDESRAAVVEDGLLLQLEIEPVSRNTCKGNIYRAVIARVEPSLQSAFVDFGNEKQGFLPVGEIHPKLRNGNQDKRAPIQDLLKARQEILVQVVRDEIGSKGATLSTFVSLPGRYLVLIPESDKTGISRKLSDEAREHIKELTETMKVPDGFGLIVRTAGETASKLELAKDLLYLSRQWAHIQQKFGESTGATLLYAERSLPVRFVRDYFSKDIEEVVIDDDPTLHEVGEFLQVLMPRGLSAVARYAGDVPLFARYGIEGKVDDVFARQVFLASGGSIVIDQTEALVSIDVNSGRMKEKDIEETARATNIEAAQEIARQMILRDMGGLIVIDFIDMREKKYVREVEQAIKDAFKNDKARTKIAHISEFGLLEMSRQRIKSSVNKGAFDSCPHCSGTGRLRAMDSVGMSILRRIYELVAQKRVKYVIAMVPPQTARYLLNARRSELAMVERQYHLTIEIVAVDGMPASNVVLEHLEEAPAETGSDRADRTKLLRVHQELDLVRNHLIKREEARVQLEMASARRAARVDYSEIYREVRDMSGDDDVRQPPRKSAPAAVEVVANATAVGEPKDAVEKPKGIWGWILGLFGAGKASEPTPEADAAGSESAGESSGPQGRGDRRDRRDRGPRGERERRHDKGDRSELRARREDRPVRDEKREEKRDEKR